MEMIEDQTENVKEHISHAATHKFQEKNVMLYAITSAFYAIFAATTALLAGYHSNEAMIEQMRSSDQWAYYQAKSIKMNIAESKIELQKSLKVRADKNTLNKIENYKSEIAIISEKAKEKESLSEGHLKKHVSFSRCVTLFQIAIGMTAFAILIKRRSFWYISIAFALGGLFFLGSGLI
jgi:Domain of unknown function (DUF4337)